MCLMAYANNKGTDQPAHPCRLISAFVVHCLDNVMSLVSVTKISSLVLASVAEQASMSLTWSETPKDTFSHNEAQSEYHKYPKLSDTRKNDCNYPKIGTVTFYYRAMGPNDADGMANSVDPDQTAPLGAVWSGSTLIAQTCLSESLGSLRWSEYYLCKCCKSCKFWGPWNYCYIYPKISPV